MDEKIKHIARTGYASKGTVYALTGILAFGAAIGLGRSSEGKLGVLKFLQGQPFGNILLGILGLGLLCYAFWRFFQSIKDPEDIGTEAKDVVKRIGFFFSGLVYLGLGVYSIYHIFNPASGGSKSGGSSMIPSEYLDYVFYAVAIGLAIKAVFQIVKAYKGDFLRKFHLNSLSNINTRKTIKWLGYAGMVSRAIVIGIVSYFFFRAADTASQGDIKGTSDAFSFLRQNSEGPWLMGFVALGLICYGAYMFIMAKYRRFDD
ncbi:DUF1206 domain-containing protein [Costertonia aggregata]|uniref:DUF1206 domain-containing protein n=1 Tax=Costertonia aggregata TaxID=343403 RepID=A0A7H9ASR4_9FLAO|nr:DUF1206 domain-containing protein [Costertonia aggregata]QLG46494.1 DUF1206 domain-containing protein [Costertonia aggregata]